MSGAPSINGTNQFPKPTIMTGIPMKKITRKAWAVTIDKQQSDSLSLCYLSICLFL